MLEDGAGDFLFLSQPLEQWPRLGLPNEAVIYIVAVNVPAGDRSPGIIHRRPGPLAGARARVPKFEIGESSERTSLEPVNDETRVPVCSRDCPGDVDAKCGGARAGERARRRIIVGGQRAVAAAHEAVSYVVRVQRVSRDRAVRVDAGSDGAYRSGCVELSDGAVRLADEAVRSEARIEIESGDRAIRTEARFLAT